MTLAASTWILLGAPEFFLELELGGVGLPAGGQLGGISDTARARNA